MEKEVVIIFPNAKANRNRAGSWLSNAICAKPYPKERVSGRIETDGPRQQTPDGRLDMIWKSNLFESAPEHRKRL